MKRLVILTAISVIAVIGNTGVASAAGTRATVTHYPASYDCPCFGHFDLTGVHLTNARFPGDDQGPSSASTIGGRDNFSGTVTQPPTSPVTWSGPGGSSCAREDMWESDYNGNLFTCSWSETINPDGSVSGWAVYPSGG
jgi:hypothetical protein